MSELLGFNDSFFSRGSLYSNLKRPNFFLSLGNTGDLYCPPQKRSCISTPLVFSNDEAKKQQWTSIEVLPDQCLFEIFRRLPSDQEKSACACVSKRWLMLLSDIHANEYYSNKIRKETLPPPHVIFSSKNNNGVRAMEIETDGHLSRSLEGRKATDIRLVSIAVGIPSRGGLGELFIRGSNPARGITNVGLRAIARGCPFLRILLLWNLSSVGDEALIEIANGCHQLEKLDFCKCPLITDKALLAIAKNCPKLSELTLDSCSNIGNEGLKAVSQYCSNLKSIMIKNCPLVGDQGIASLLSSTSYTLSKLNLQALSITDASLAVIGHYGMAVIDLVLSGLQNVSERGFWVMGNCHGLQMVKSLIIKCCQGITDVGLTALGKGCPNLKHFCLHKSSVLSDIGLVSFVKSAGMLETLQVHDCHRITQFGVVSCVCGGKLRCFSLSNCLGIQDAPLPSLLHCSLPCKSLRSFSIDSCPGFSDATLAMLGNLCPQLQCLELKGLNGITDQGLLPLIQTRDPNSLKKVGLSNCVNVTDEVVSSIVRHHGRYLNELNLSGCRKISDSSVIAIAESCNVLRDLDLSKCGITDSSIRVLGCAKEFLKLQILCLSGCLFITDKCLSSMGELGAMLSLLNLHNCSGMSSGALNLLTEQLWRCDVLT